MIIHIRTIPERRGRLPLAAAVAQTTGDVAQFGTAFIHAGIPNSEQIAIRAFGDAGAVIMRGEQGAKRVLLNLHERLWRDEHGNILPPFFDLHRALPHILSMKGSRRGRQGFAGGRLTEHDTKTRFVIPCLRQPGSAIR